MEIRGSEMRVILLLTLALGVASAACAAPFTVGDARTLPLGELARQLVGEKLGSKVIEVIRHEYNVDPDVPDYVELYTQPELTNPRLNGICRTDVITIEYNWYDLDTATMNAAPTPVSPSHPLAIAHIESHPRYKAFPVPPGEPGTGENDRAQAAACAAMTTALDAFRAPSAGDAQWLAAIERQYVNPKKSFPFACSDFGDQSCAQARRALAGLKLEKATAVEVVGCPNERTGDQLDTCYRLTFAYPSADRVSDRQDYREFESADPEWVLAVYAGIRNGMAPVRIRSINLKHLPKPMTMY
jgi:hypothetical protein